MGKLPSVFLFCEQYGDSTQLLFLRARYYNPTNGRFQSRDTWSGDVNRPLSLNRWMYVEGNPVNFVDQTGNSPHPWAPNGYAEGVSSMAASWFSVWAVSGNETVYDFHTLERAKFSIKGKISVEEPTAPIGFCLTFLSESVTPYFSIIWGFDNEGIETDYEGDTEAFQLGVSIPTEIVAGVGAGLVVSWSHNYADTKGLSFYGEASIGGLAGDSPLTIAKYSVTYTMVERTKFINTEDMVNAILTGDGLPFFAPARELAVKQLKFYRGEDE